MNAQTIMYYFFSFKKFGSIRADLIEQMRFKQRLKVIQTLEDTTKRNVVSTEIMHYYYYKLIIKHSKFSQFLHLAFQ